MSARDANRSTPEAAGPAARRGAAGDAGAEAESTPDDSGGESESAPDDSGGESESAPDDAGADSESAPQDDGSPEPAKPGRGREARQKARATGWPRRLGSWAIQLAIAAAVIWGVTRWQARRLLPTETAAPEFSLPALDGSAHSLAEARGRTVVLYFFAPWCTVCRYSSHNINALRSARSDKSLAIYAVGLEWEEPTELEQFAKEHELSVPVLRGNEDLRRAYRIDTFPTVYIIDERGAVTDRVVGYTTELGLRLRSL